MGLLPAAWNHDGIFNRLTTGLPPFSLSAWKDTLYEYYTAEQESNRNPLHLLHPLNLIHLSTTSVLFQISGSSHVSQGLF